MFLVGNTSEHLVRPGRRAKKVISDTISLFADRILNSMRVFLMKKYLSDIDQRLNHCATKILSW